MANLIEVQRQWQAANAECNAPGRGDIEEGAPDFEAMLQAERDISHARVENIDDLKVQLWLLKYKAENFQTDDNDLALATNIIEGIETLLEKSA